LTFPSTAGTGSPKRHRLAEGYAGNRTGRVIPQSGQLAQGRQAVRNLPVVFLHNLAGGSVQIAGPGIVAQSFPRFQHLIQGSRSQVRQGGKALQEPVVIGHYRRHLGLLEHDLTHPYPVGIGLTTPGQVTVAVIVPVQQNLPQLDDAVR
jgi:hypothetical protein